MLALGKKGKRSAPSRFTLSLTHRVIYYKDYIFETRPPPQWHVGPEWDSTTKCPVSWENTPAGTSRRSVQSVIDFVNDYTRRFGDYNFLVNNCHHVANRVSAFLSEELNWQDKMKSVTNRRFWLIGLYIWMIIYLHRTEIVANRLIDYLH